MIAKIRAARAAKAAEAARIRVVVAEWLVDHPDEALCWIPAEEIVNG